MRAILLLAFSLFAGLQLAGQNALAEAEQLAADHQYEASSSALLSFIAGHPHRKHDIARAWWLHSRNLLAQGRLDDARMANDSSLLHRNRLRTHDTAENYWLRGRIELAADQPEAALDALLRGMNFLIEDPLIFADLHTLSARAYARLSYWDEALDALETARDILMVEVGTDHPLLVRVYRDWAKLLVRMEQFASAAQKLNEAVTVLPNNVERAKLYLRIWQIVQFMNYQDS